MNSPLTLSGPVKRVDIIKTIKVTALRGTGDAGDPVREVIGWYDQDGILIYEHDTWAGAHQHE